MIIKLYEEKYRDDLIFMVLQAKDALGRKPTINTDLLNINENYFDRGDMFWVAINADDRVIGCIGYSKTENPAEAFLHRLYVKASEKRKGIGTKLLQTAENEMRKQGIVVSLVHLGAPKEQWFESYSFYPKNGYLEYTPRYMRKDLQIPVYLSNPLKMPYFQGVSPVLCSILMYLPLFLPLRAETRANFIPRRLPYPAVLRKYASLPL